MSHQGDLSGLEDMQEQAGFSSGVHFDKSNLQVDCSGFRKLVILTVIKVQPFLQARMKDLAHSLGAVAVYVCASSLETLSVDPSFRFYLPPRYTAC